MQINFVVLNMKFDLYDNRTLTTQQLFLKFSLGRLCTFHWYIPCSPPGAVAVKCGTTMIRNNMKIIILNGMSYVLINFLILRHILETFYVQRPIAKFTRTAHITYYEK